MTYFLSYWFWPNPAGWHYHDARVETLLIVSATLVVLSFVISRWRARNANPITRNLSKSWSSASFWFGFVALILTVSRVETIQFLSMRILWALWFLFLALFVLLQIVQFQRRHYTVVKRAHVADERDRYLPKKKVR